MRAARLISFELDLARLVLRAAYIARRNAV